ncbi:hypothetical protein J2Z58_003034 [Halobacillus andaensis]|nr:hypothetical protein [Halobacillus andaensis]
MIIKVSKGFFGDLTPLNPQNPFIPSVLVGFKKFKKIFASSKMTSQLVENDGPGHLII